MLPRRPILLITLGLLVLAGLGLRDWPLEGRKALAFANRALTPYGLTVSAEGPATFRLLPLPQVAMSRIRVADATGPVLVEGEILVTEIDPWGLATGRSPVGALRLDKGRLSHDADAWAGPVARIREKGGTGLVPPRITLTGARIGDGRQARDIELDVAWPILTGAVAVTARATWRDVPTQLSLSRLRLSDLFSGHRTPFAAEAAWPGGGLSLDGMALLPAELAGGPTFAGHARLRTDSLPTTLAWLGGDAPLAPLTAAFSLEGNFETQGRAVSWPLLKIGAGSTVLEGAGAFSLGTGEAPRLSARRRSLPTGSISRRWRAPS